MQDCVLCREPGGTIVWENPLCRVVIPAAPEQPGLARVVLGRHVAEMSDLGRADRQALLDVVIAVEAALRQILAPHKVNLASLGNLVPHVHWHVIPRWRDDPWFPAAIWAPAARPPAPRPLPPDFAVQLTAALRVSLP